MLKDDIKQMKKCCRNCKQFKGDFCKVIQCVHPNTVPDPDTFYCAYFKPVTSAAVIGLKLIGRCLDKACNKIQEVVDKKSNVYTVKEEDIKESK